MTSMSLVVVMNGMTSMSLVVVLSLRLIMKWSKSQRTTELLVYLNDADIWLYASTINRNLRDTFNPLLDGVSNVRYNYTHKYIV